MPADDIEAVKNFVVDQGYSGFCVWAGTAYIKKADHQLTNGDLQSLGFLSTVVFYLPVPVEDPFDVFGEAPKTTSTTTIATTPTTWTTTTTSAPRRQCRYGHGCYNKNPQHKRDFSHPGDADWHGADKADPAKATTPAEAIMPTPDWVVGQQIEVRSGSGSWRRGEVIVVDTEQKQLTIVTQKTQIILPLAHCTSDKIRIARRSKQCCPGLTTRRH
jgi:hypothetical protein